MAEENHKTLLQAHIPNALHQRIKLEAINRGSTMSRLVSDLLHAALNLPTPAGVDPMPARLRAYLHERGGRVHRRDIQRRFGISDRYLGDCIKAVDLECFLTSNDKRQRIRAVRFKAGSTDDLQVQKARDKLYDALKTEDERK